jgi:hypothetical protein
MILALLAGLAAGCGGSSGGGGGGGGGGAKVADSAKLANCLNNDNWISAPSGNEVQGSSAAGANFDLLIYPTDAAARAAAAKKPKKSTAVVGTSVVTFVGAPTGVGPGQPLPIPKSSPKDPSPVPRDSSARSRLSTALYAGRRGRSPFALTGPPQGRHPHRGERCTAGRFVTRDIHVARIGRC